MNLRTLGWAAYLAVSWTWCIGMFFPVLLVRDYGIWGFVVFAVPNVVGAAAMGWVLCRDGMSEHLVHRHRHAMVAFSAVTAAFHGFWLLWLAVSVVQVPLLYGFIVLCLLMSLIRGSQREQRDSSRWNLFACGVVLVSSVFCIYLVDKEVGLSGRQQMPSLGGGLWPLAFPAALGFILCPYLDLTFHRARQAMTPVAARASFTLGFGVCFLGMILLTLAYSGLVIDLMAGTAAIGAASLSAIVLHVGFQTMWTIDFHTEEVSRHSSAKHKQLVTWAFFLGGTLAALPLLVGIEPVHAGMSIGELIYRCFMVFYGLVFPAYVWLAMWPTRDGHSGIKGRDGRRKRLVLAGVVGLALPFYWMGFIERQEPWLVGGVAVVLLGRLFVRRK